MVRIRAFGTVKYDGIDWPEQGITITGEGNDIKQIEYLDYKVLAQILQDTEPEWFH